MDRQINLTISLNEAEVQALEKAGYTKETSIKEMLANAIHDILNSDLEKTVETNIGTIPKEDYDQYVLEQYGFSLQKDVDEEALEIEWGDEARYRECELEKRYASDVNDVETYPSFQGIAADYKTARGFGTYYDYMYQYGENYDKFMLYNICASNKDTIDVSIDSDSAVSGYVSFEIPVYKLDVKQNGGMSFGEAIHREFEKYLQGEKDYNDVFMLTEQYYKNGESHSEYNGYKLDGFEISKNEETVLLVHYIPKTDLYTMEGRKYGVGGGCYRLETNNEYIGKAFQEVHNEYAGIKVKHIGKLFSEQEKQFIEETYDLIKRDVRVNLYISDSTMNWIEKMDSPEVKKALCDAYNAILQLDYTFCPVMTYYKNSGEGYDDYLKNYAFSGLFSNFEDWCARIQSEQMKWTDTCKSQLAVYKNSESILDEYKIKIPEYDMPIEAQALIAENEFIKQTGIMPDRDSLLLDAENAAKAAKHSGDYPFRFEEEGGSYIDYEIVSVNENGTVDIGVREGNYNNPHKKYEAELITVVKEQLKGLDIGCFLNEKVNEKYQIEWDDKKKKSNDKNMSEK